VTTDDKSEAYRPVRRTLAILNALVASDEPLRLVDGAREIGAPTSSAHLLLKEMVNAGLLTVTADRRYEPGPALVGLSLAVVHKQRLVQVAKPVMRALVEATGEDVYIAVPLDRSIVYADRLLSKGSLRLDIALGVPRELHATAVGQLFLAMLPPDECAEILATASLDPYTPYTITDASELQAKLRLIREHGYATTDQERYENIIAMAAPVIDASGDMAAALSLSVVRGRGLGHELGMARQVCESAAELSRLIHGAPHPRAHSKTETVA
jgi:DNA-binding IclR family transcriptional regulator